MSSQARPKFTKRQNRLIHAHPLSGFSLLEVLLAIAILSLVGALIYGGFAQTTINKKRVETDLDHSRTVHMALERMARELSMAFVSTHVNINPNLQTMRTAFIGKDRPGNDRIDFTSFSHRRLYRNVHESDQNSISYFLTSHPNDPSNKVLARREQNRIDEDPSQGGKSQILLENVDSFDVEYFDPLTSQWIKTWNTTQATGQLNRLPSQIRIKLGVKDPHRPRRKQEFGTRVSIPLTYALNHSNYKPIESNTSSPLSQITRLDRF